jgi:hypothetical protein
LRKEGFDRNATRGGLELRCYLAWRRCGEQVVGTGVEEVPRVDRMDVR